MTERLGDGLQNHLCQFDSDSTLQHRGISSAGRAPALHAGGQEFETPWLHQDTALK